MSKDIGIVLENLTMEVHEASMIVYALAVQLNSDRALNGLSLQLALEGMSTHLTRIAKDMSTCGRTLDVPQRGKGVHQSDA